MMPIIPYILSFLPPGFTIISNEICLFSDIQHGGSFEEKERARWSAWQRLRPDIIIDNI
jgi:hypothetical protein